MTLANELRREENVARQRRQAHESLDRLLDEVLVPGVDATADLRLVVKQGGLCKVRHLLDRPGDAEENR